MNFRVSTLCFAALVAAAPHSSAQSQQLSQETQQSYLSLCGLSAGTSISYKFMGDPEFGVNDAAPVIAFDPATHPDGALACIPLRSPGTSWPQGGIYIYSDGSVRGKFSNTISGIRLGVTQSTAIMAPGAAKQSNTTIYDMIEWSEFRVTAAGGFFGGAEAEGDAARIGRGLGAIRSGGAVYFEFKSENGSPANVWRPFEVDRMAYPARASAKAVWEALNWKRS